MYSLVLDISSCLVSDGSPSGTKKFEPGHVLSALPPSLTSSTMGVIIWLTDGEHTVEYQLDNFLSKDYRCNNGYVKFGGKQLVLSRLCIRAGYKIIFENLQSITDNVMG